MASWRDGLSAETVEMLRDFEAMQKAANAYGVRLSDLIGDFSEGYLLPERKRDIIHYRATYLSLYGELEDLAMALGKALGIVPMEWIDTENDIMDGDSWSGAVEQEIRERDEMDQAAEFFRKLDAGEVE